MGRAQVRLFKPCPKHKHIIRHNLSQDNVAIQHKLRTDTFPMFLGFDCLGFFLSGEYTDITTSRLFLSSFP